MAPETYGPKSYESESCSVASNSCDPMDYSPWTSPGQNTGVGSLSLLQGIFPTQALNPGLQHCRQILYQLSHQRRPRILEWVADPFPSGSSWPRNRTRVSLRPLKSHFIHVSPSNHTPATACFCSWILQVWSSGFLFALPGLLFAPDLHLACLFSFVMTCLSHYLLRKARSPRPA